ncbi:MAG: hypothetical protein Q7U82_10945 [Gammaproteobacteria bacterium]|nr:hypothetical protein [Gammaproteobacteria bacterium]
MSTKTGYCVTPLLLLLFCGVGHAQESFIPYSDGYVTERQESYTLRATSAENLDAIPHRELYRAVFLRILGNPMLFQKLSYSDAQIMLHLPDHTDTSFQQRLQSDLRAACKEIGEQWGAKDVATLVSIFLSAEESYEKKLDGHYETVIKRLSSAGQELVVAQIADLAKGESLAYSETDYVGFSKEFPKVMETRLASGCDRITKELNVPTRKLLTDNFVHRRDLGFKDQ